MALFFTSDHHFGHHNIIGYTGRPFLDVDRMREWFVEQWNFEIGAEDEVWVLGDFALGRLAESLTVTSRLNGIKKLLPGNHDRCWPGHKKAARERQRYLDVGFDEILDGDQTMTIAGQNVKISHFPYRWTGDHEGIDERYAEHKPVDEGGWLLHGHVHERWRIRGRQINVGVDAWAGHPLRLEQVEYYLTHPYPHDREPFPWPKGAEMSEADYEKYRAWMREVARSVLDRDEGLGLSKFRP